MSQADLGKYASHLHEVHKHEDPRAVARAEWKQAKDAA